MGKVLDSLFNRMVNQLPINYIGQDGGWYESTDSVYSQCTYPYYPWTFEQCGFGSYQTVKSKPDNTFIKVDRNEVLTDAEPSKAADYVGKIGFFADSFTELEHKVITNKTMILSHVFADEGEIFVPTKNDCHGEEFKAYRLFLPLIKVSGMKHVRPIEFIDDLEKLGLAVGTVFEFRAINSIYINRTMIIDIGVGREEGCFITIGKEDYSALMLYDDYEFRTLESNQFSQWKSEWRRFMIEE